MEVKSHGRAMGSDVEVIINGESSHMNFARQRLDDLESKWSRFIPSSDISQVNNSQGEPCRVSPDTIDLLLRMKEAYEATRGYYNPTIYGDMLRLGYDTSFENIAHQTPSDCDFHRSDFNDLVIDSTAKTVTLPPHIGIDPGGIGKGYAADIVAREVLVRGAIGCLANIGGDICTLGEPCEGIGYRIDIEDEHGTAVESVALLQGAIATSTTRKRAWVHEGNRVHHLIDPITGENPINGTYQATVLARHCWQAEVLTKPAMLMDPHEACELIAARGAQAHISTSQENVMTSEWKYFRLEGVAA